MVLSDNILTRSVYMLIGGRPGGIHKNKIMHRDLDLCKNVTWRRASGIHWSNDQNFKSSLTYLNATFSVCLRYVVDYLLSSCPSKLNTSTFDTSQRCGRSIQGAIVTQTCRASVAMQTLARRG